MHGLFHAVEKSHSVRVIQIARRADNHADRATRMERAPALANNAAQRDHLRANGENQIWILMNTILHV